MTTARSADEIPGPKGLPLVGNMFDIPAGHTMQTLMDLTREYGPMLRLRTPFGDRFVVSGLDEVDQLCDDTRFDKFVGVSQRIIRELRPSAGLFTADTDDPDWQQAHNILLPNFSQQAMQGYLPMMVDIAGQLMQKWDRLNPGEPVDVTADMTRLTLDTIALCGFGYRFNSFYREDQHPFVEAMLGMLTESQTQARQLKVQRALRRRAARRMEADVAYMESVVASIIAERRKAGDAADHQDLLSCMLHGVDKRSGEKLSDANIIAQCNTFLVAGHETTSGLLSFAVSYLLKAPEVVARANEEVDRVLGTDLAVTPTYQQVQGLTYVTQILNEILRLWPTAPAFTRYPYEDVVLGGYAIPKGTSLTALTPMLHRLPSVWGENAEEFDPDHFRPETRAAIPPNAFRPFGAGQRACIGRQFAMQEAVLVLGMLLQRFELVDEFDYRLRIKEALTLKPEGLRIALRPRTGRTTGTTPAPPQVTGGTLTERPAPRLLPMGDRHNTPLTVLFGSNLGTAEGIATRIAQDGAERGFAVTLGALDDHVGELPSTGALVVVCASYNGQPPDNAERFCRWIQAADTKADAAAGLAFAVFGCGNMDWASTYQAVPTLIDTALAAHGGSRIRPRGEGDARSDFDGQYQRWYAELWPALTEALGLDEQSAGAAEATERLHVTMTNRQTTNPLVMSYRALPATVLVNRELNGAGAGTSTRHVEIALPPGLEYSTGDHLGVLPRNGWPIIRRVIARFGLDAGTYLTISQAGSSYTHLPIDEPAPLLGILGSCVELQDVASRSDIAVLAGYTSDPVQREELLGLSTLDDDGVARYRERVGARRATLLDLLDEFPSCDLPFHAYLDLLPPLRPRYYSISSSPAVTKSCDVTVGLLRGPARRGEGTFTGVCSGHLEQAGPESTVFVFVRRPRIPFRPPENPHIPMIMVGAGTGLAPFRGFLQERAALKDRGVPVAESLLFFGCRTPDTDFLYADELKGYEAAGVARLHTAFSRATESGRKYVQHAIAAEQEQVWDLLEQGAIVYVCGNAATMAPGVRAALTEVYRARTGGSETAGDTWLAGLRAQDRYLEDIWGETDAR
ncbi:bifunctional cytochrome P450/NADPH--P450 reductase [Pseudonocardia pini]|uniref:bifunctional cytochrome P450/NADPH--P450 reductase n=1 Tax=Pseudonocardia pini TaxID=2758030 RepID=UPI0015F001FC|nr:cytochrome P450 [Pseudonocardia pini]